MAVVAIVEVPGSAGHGRTLVNLANLYKQTNSPLDALRLLAQLPEPPRERQFRFPGRRHALP